MSGGYWSLGDGTNGEATHVSVDGGPWRPIVDITMQLGSVVPPPPPPPPTGTPRLGSYGSNGAGNDSDSLTYFGAYPEVANDYLQVGSTTGSGSYMSLVTSQTPRVNRGTACLLLLSLKGYFGSGTDNSNVGLKALANPSDPNHAAMVTVVDNYISRLKTLSEVDPSVPIYASLEGEADAKVNKYEQWLINPATAGDKINATRAEAGIGTNYFLNRLRTEAPLVKKTLWWAGTQKTIINEIWDQVGANNVDCVVGDPYTNGTQVETMLKCFTTWTNWVKVQNNYIRCGSPPQGIGECGMQTDTHTDAQVATYIKPSPSYTMRDTMRDAGVIFASWFDSGRDKGHEITDGSHPLACAAMADSLAAS